MNIGTTGVGPVAPAAGPGAHHDEKHRFGAPRPERVGASVGVAAPQAAAAVRRAEASRRVSNPAGEGEPVPKAELPHDPAPPSDDGTHAAGRLPEVPLRELSIRVGKHKDRVVIQVLDSRTKEVVREIPPEDVAKTLEDLNLREQAVKAPPRRAVFVDGEA